TLTGESDVTTGGLPTVNVSDEVIPPPGSGFDTETGTVIPTARSLAEMAARSSVELTSVVGRSRPFQRALEAGTKVVPRTVIEKHGAPSGTLLGLSVLSVR